MQKFTEKIKLLINLLSDPDSRIQKLYEAWKPKKMTGQEFPGTACTTFLINPSGNIKKVWNNVKVRGHAEAVPGTLRNL